MKQHKREPSTKEPHLVFLVTMGSFGLRGPSEGRSYARSLYHIIKGTRRETLFKNAVGRRSWRGRSPSSPNVQRGGGVKEEREEMARQWRVKRQVAPSVHVTRLCERGWGGDEKQTLMAKHYASYEAA